MSYCSLSEAIKGSGCPRCLSDLAALRKVLEQARRVALNPSDGSRTDDLANAIAEYDGDDTDDGAR